MKILVTGAAGFIGFHLVKIGNSQGIRIPKPLILQAHLENVDLELEVLENGLDTKDEALLEELLNNNYLKDWQ